MISLIDIYHVVEATVPLYVSMILAYASVRWWKLFNADQCAGINKFVAKFSIPLLSFQVIADNNPYEMNLGLILADLLQKVLAVVALYAVVKLGPRGGLKWVITGLSVSTLPNTLIIGLPIIRATYGGGSVNWLAQIIVLQSILWYNFLLILYELNAATTAQSAGSPTPGCIAGNIETGVQEEDKETGARASRKSHEALKILAVVWKKMIRNPNTYATVIGLVWALIRFRWGLKLPAIVNNSIRLLSEGGLGMAMFSMGLFMASQTSLIPCGKRMAAVAMASKFLVGPAFMAASSLPFGLKGLLFKVAILQAALPQGIVPFVFAKEYNVHPEILSTGVIFGMIIAVPVALAYYFLLDLV